MFCCLFVVVLFFYSWRKGLYSHSEAFSHRVRKSVSGSGVHLENTTTVVDVLARSYIRDDPNRVAC